MRPAQLAFDPPGKPALDLAGRRGRLRGLSPQIERAREMLGADLPSPGEDCRALDGVAQLPDVPRPGPGHQVFNDIVPERGRVARARAHLAQEMSCQGRDVLAPITKRRYAYGEDAEPEEQVLPELARGHQLAERSVGRGQETDVDGPGPRITDGRHLAMLDRPEQLDLDLRSDVADLVQQHGSPVGELEQSVPILNGPRERAAEMAEELALDQPGAEGREADRQEGPLRRVL